MISVSLKRKVKHSGRRKYMCVCVHMCLPKQQMVSIKLLLLLGSGTS